MATSAFKSTSRRGPIGTSPPSTDGSPTSSSHRRSRSLSRFSCLVPTSGILPTPSRKLVRASDFPEISLDDLAIEFFSGKVNCSELDDESVSSRRSWRDRVKPEIRPAASRRRSRSVSRQPDGANSVTAGCDTRERFVSRRNDGGGGGEEVGGVVEGGNDGGGGWK